MDVQLALKPAANGRFSNAQSQTVPGLPILRKTDAVVRNRYHVEEPAGTKGNGDAPVVPAFKGMLQRVDDQTPDCFR